MDRVRNSHEVASATSSWPYGADITINTYVHGLASSEIYWAWHPSKKLELDVRTRPLREAGDRWWHNLELAEVMSCAESESE